MRKLILLFCLVLAIRLSAQNHASRNQSLTNSFYEIILKDGTIFKAQIHRESMDSLNFVFRTSLIDRMRIPMSSIKSIKEITIVENKSKRIIEKQFFTKKENYKKELNENSEDTNNLKINPNATRYFYGVSAIPLKKGNGYFQNTLFLINSVNFGFSNHFSIGVGTELFSTFAERDFPLISISPKMGYKINDFLHLGAVALINYNYNVSLDNSEKYFNRFHYLLNGLITLGDENNNITLGVGNAKFFKEFELRPDFTLSYMLRFGDNISFINDICLIPYREIEYTNSVESKKEKYSLNSSAGFRYFYKNFAIDFGLLNLIGFGKIDKTDYGNTYSNFYYNQYNYKKYVLLPYFDFVINF